jgi:hypothetical protein
LIAYVANAVKPPVVEIKRDGHVRIAGPGLFRRRGKKVWAAGWFHDGSAVGPAKTGYGNNWVIAAIVVRLPFLNRPVGVPVLAKLVIKDTRSPPRGCVWPAAWRR